MLFVIDCTSLFYGIKRVSTFFKISKKELLILCHLGYRCLNKISMGVKIQIKTYEHFYKQFVPNFCA